MNARNFVISFFGSCLLVSCGSGGGSSPIKELLCTSGHAKGILTVGLNLALLEGLPLIKGNAASSNEGLKNLLNEALGLVVNAKSFNVASVTSAVEGDSVRFLKLGGTFGSGVGVATGLFAKAVSSSSSLKDVFSFIREGYKVIAGNTFDEGAYGEFLRVSNPFAGALLSEVKANPKQWAYSQTRFAEAYSALSAASPTRNEIRVAVVDTGVDAQHPDLVDVLLPGYNAIDGSKNTDDKNGHGTHCAGIIAAQAKSGPEAALGVAANATVKIIPIKVLGDDGSGSTDAIEKGIRWAVKEGKADVISLSLGGGVEYAAVNKGGGLKNPIFAEALESGVVVVVAAGNESCPLGGQCSLPGFLTSQNFEQYTVLPCAYEGTICVGATDANENLAVYSNYSSAKKAPYRTKSDVNAPGTNIYSTWPTDKGGPYKTISGTSMATPYVAGVAALLKAYSANPAAVNQEKVRKLLADGLVYQDDAKAKSGTGRVDFYGTSYYYAESELKKKPALPLPVSAPNPVKDLNPPSGGGVGGDGTISTVWDLLCAL